MHRLRLLRPDVSRLRHHRLPSLRKGGSKIMDGAVELCDGCGACASMCPMRSFYPDFPVCNTPRAVIRRMRLGEPRNRIKGFAFCLDCTVCEQVCPQGVRFRELLSRMPLEMVTCRVCGREIRARVLLSRVAELTSRDVSVCERCEQRGAAERLLCSFPAYVKSLTAVERGSHPS